MQVCKQRGIVHMLRIVPQCAKSFSLRNRRFELRSFHRLYRIFLPVETGWFLSVSKNPFRHAGRRLKRPEAEQLAPVGVHRYGRVRVATEVKILAKQAELQQNHSMYVILRNEVTKNLFSTDTAKILRVRSG